MSPAVAALCHVPHETLGTLANAFERAGVSFRYVDLYRHAPRGLEIRELAGLVVLGGPMNVDETERYPFLAAELGWLREAFAIELPVLGICLGSQLMARALGSPVRAHGVKEIGWYLLEMTGAAGDDPLFSGSRTVETVFQWHGDTFDLPAGAVHLARSAACEQQAFRYGRRAWGLQFHAEVTGPMIDQWLAEPGNRCELAGLDYIDTAEIRRRAREELPRLERLGKRLFDPFAALCRERG